MKKVITISAFLIVFFSSVNGQIRSENELDCVHFYAKIDSLDNAIIFDIRLGELFEKSRLNNAVWAGTKDSFEPYLKQFKKDTPIFIYCEIGKRTKQCISWLYSKGFYQVYQLKGGIDNWAKNGYPIDSTKVKIDN